MKKLLLLFSLSIAGLTYAQDVLVNENCETLTIGNVSTDLTGATAGQNNWYTYVSATAVPAGQLSDFQVINVGGVNGQAFQLTGSSAATAATRYLSQDISAAWTNRTSGNDILNVEYDYFSGPATTSANSMRILVYDTTGAQILCGLSVKLSTSVIQGVCYYDNSAASGGSIANYLIGLASTAPTVTPNTWYRFGVSFNYNTGDVIFREVNQGLFDVTVTGAALGSDALEVDLTAGTTTGNAVAGVGVFDNINCYTSASDILLGAKSNSIANNKFTVYPNPVKNVVNVSNADASISSIEITDLNGRVVKTLNVTSLTDVQVTVSDLSQGVYMMKITSDKGTAVKKIIKE
jgi:hypothetical protein